MYKSEQSIKTRPKKKSKCLLQILLSHLLSLKRFEVPLKDKSGLPSNLEQLIELLCYLSDTEWTYNIVILNRNVRKKIH